MSSKKSQVYPEQLDDNVLNAVTENVGNVSRLATENRQSIVAAVNEIQGKQIISNAIGSPLSSTDKFSDMGEKINDMTADFKSRLLNMGIAVSGTDKLTSLIEKLDGLVVGENSGIKFESGRANITITTGISAPTVTVSNLSFKPTYVFCYIPNTVWNATTSTNYTVQNLFFSNIAQFNWEDSKGYFKVTINDNNSFTVAHYLYSTIQEVAGDTYFNWYAFGSGEGDGEGNDVLLETLAGILGDEGVGLTGEESMAELIIKVDEEFERKNSVASSTLATGSFNLNTTIKSTDYASNSYTVNFNPGFTPKTVMVNIPYGLAGSYAGCSNFWIQSGNLTVLDDVGSYTGYMKIDSITSSSFDIIMEGKLELHPGEYTWMALGNEEVGGGNITPGPGEDSDPNAYYIYNNGIWESGNALSASYGSYTTVTENRNHIAVKLNAEFGSSSVNLTTKQPVSLESIDYDTIVFKYEVATNNTTVSSYTFYVGYDNNIDPVSTLSTEARYSYVPLSGLTGSPRIYLSCSFSEYTGSVDLYVYEIYLTKTGTMPL